MKLNRNPFAPLMAKLNAMTPRERVIATGVLLVVSYALADYTLLAPFQTTLTTQNGQLAQLRQEVQTLEGAVVDIMRRHQTDPDAVIKSTLAAQKSQLTTLDQQLVELQQAIVGVIPPDQMAQFLEQLLRQNHPVEILAATNLPPIPVTLTLPAVVTGQPDQVVPLLYRHAIQIRFQGEYRNIVTYLKAVEALPWRVVWQSIQLDTSAYPQVKVDLIIETLSLKQGFADV